MESPEEYELNEEDMELFNCKFKKDERPKIFAEGIRTAAKIALDKMDDLKYEGKTNFEIIQALHEHFSNIYKDKSEITQ